MATRSRRSTEATERPRTPTDRGEAPSKSTAGQDASVRVARLRERVSRMRIRGFSMDIPRLLMVGGGFLLILGLVLIGAAWYGAAHTPFLFEQIPYLISGGLLGLGLAFAGGAFYFAYWLTRQVHETKRQADRTEEALGRIERRLAESLAATSGGSRGSAPRAGTNGSFVATSGGTMFHRPDCQVVAGRSDLRKVDPDARGLQPCKMCDPLGSERQPV